MRADGPHRCRTFSKEQARRPSASRPSDVRGIRRRAGPVQRLLHVIRSGGAVRERHATDTFSSRATIYTPPHGLAGQCTDDHAARDHVVVACAEHRRLPGYAREIHLAGRRCTGPHDDDFSVLMLRHVKNEVDVVALVIELHAANRRLVIGLAQFFGNPAFFQRSLVRRFEIADPRGDGGNGPAGAGRASRGGR